MTRIDPWSGTKWNGLGQTRSLPQDWLSRVLAKATLFDGLSKQDLRTVAGLAELRQNVDGVVVVRVGTRGDAMHVILDGSAVMRPTDALMYVKYLEPRHGRPHAPRSA